MNRAALFWIGRSQARPTLLGAVRALLGLALMVGVSCRSAAPTLPTQAAALAGHLSPIERQEFDAIRKIHEPGLGLIQRFRESGLFVDTAEWWVAGRPELLPFAGSWRGLPGVAEFQRQLDATMQYDKVELREYLVSGNQVAVIFFGEGVARATRKPFRSEIVRLYTFAEGKVVRVRNFYDTESYVRAVRGDPVSPSASRTAELYDPVTMDPPAADSAYPARMVEIALESGGERLNGLLYVAAGAGPHPAVLLLHGNPGYERSLDLAQALRRGGYTVLFFDYRGNWGSGGTFSRTHALEDVHAALHWVRSGATARQFRIDSSRVALVGHSMGGWLALMAAVADPRVVCVAALDSRNIGAYGRLLRRDRSAESALVRANDSLTAPGAPYRAEAGGAGLVAEMKANAERWDVTAHARALSDRPLLLVSAVFKADQDSLVAALDRVQARRVTALAWRTDHTFSDRRIALARTVGGWLRSSCTP